MSKRIGWSLQSSRYFICLDAPASKKFYFAVHVDGDPRKEGEREQLRWEIASAVCKNAKTQEEVFRVRSIMRIPQKRFRTRDDALLFAFKLLSEELNLFLRKVA